MRTRPLIFATAFWAALAGQASMAAPNAPTSVSGVEVVASKPEPTPLSGLDIVVHRATPLSGVEIPVPPCLKANRSPGPDLPEPKVVSSFPEKGAVVRPGLLILRVTFDRPMACIGLLDRYAFLVDPCPAPLRSPMISRDRRTFLTLCTVGKEMRYGLSLRRFTSLGGRPLDHYDLEFETSDRDAVNTVEEAMAQDKWLQKAANPGS